MKVYEFLATGFEPIEAIGPVDILRRGDIDTKTVSITGDKLVEASNGTTVKADLLIEEADCSDADLLLLPGGMPGATNLNACMPLRQMLAAHHAKGRRIGAICAAPIVLGSLGLLKGRRATCYPGFEGHLAGAEYTGEMCTVDGNIITGKGPGAKFEYAFTLLAALTGREKAREVAAAMLCD